MRWYPKQNSVRQGKDGVFVNAMPFLYLLQAGIKKNSEPMDVRKKTSFRQNAHAIKHL